MYIDGNRLKVVRKQKKLTQEELANIVGVSVHTIRKYESNERDPDMGIFKSLCETLEISSDYLLGLSDIKNVTMYIVEMKGYPEKAIKIIDDICDIVNMRERSNKLEDIEIIINRLKNIIKK